MTNDNPNPDHIADAGKMAKPAETTFGELRHGEHYCYPDRPDETYRFNGWSNDGYCRILSVSRLLPDGSYRSLVYPEVSPDTPVIRRRVEISVKTWGVDGA